jgi:hypothetical protein
MRVADIRFSGMCPVKAFLGGRPRADSSALKNRPDLHVPPPATVRRSDLASIELSGDCIETGMAGPLVVPNVRQDVGSKLGRPRLTSHAMRFTAPAGSGIPNRSFDIL